MLISHEPSIKTKEEEKNVFVRSIRQGVSRTIYNPFQNKQTMLLSANFRGHSTSQNPIAPGIIFQCCRVRAARTWTSPAATARVPIFFGKTKTSRVTPISVQ